jgi:hypothetical protein
MARILIVFVPEHVLLYFDMVLQMASPGVKGFIREIISNQTIPFLER